LRKGALILKVDQQAVKTVAEAKSAIEKRLSGKRRSAAVKAPDAAPPTFCSKSAVS